MPNTIEGPPNPFPRDFLSSSLPTGTLLHRVHDKKFAGNSPNPSTASLYRFSPIFDLANNVVPTLYAGDTQHCAFMETVFRNISSTPGRRSIRASKLDTRVYSTIITTRPLKLGRLDATALARFGLQQQQLTATDAVYYAITARWAEAFFRTDSSLDGIAWPSHRSSPNMAYMLFGKPTTSDDLKIITVPKALLSDPHTWAALKAAANDLKTKIPDFRDVR